MTSPTPSFSELVSSAVPNYEANLEIARNRSEEAENRANRIKDAIKLKQERDKSMNGINPVELWGSEGAEICANFLNYMRKQEANGVVTYPGSAVLEHKPPYNNIVHPEFNKHPEAKRHLFKAKPTDPPRSEWDYSIRESREIKKAYKHDHHHMEEYEKSSPSYLRAYPIAYVFEKKSADKRLPLRSAPGHPSLSWKMEILESEDPSMPRPVFLCEDGLVRAGEQINSKTKNRTFGTLPLFYSKNPTSPGQIFNEYTPVQPFTGILTNLPTTNKKDYNNPVERASSPLEITFVPLEDMLVSIAARNNTHAERSKPERLFTII